jgi:hypothetical protein
MQRFTAVIRDLALTFAGGTLTTRVGGDHEQALNALLLVAAVAGFLFRATADSAEEGEMS